MEQITQRAKLLQKYLVDEQKELQALYALQALMVRLEQPASEYRLQLVIGRVCFLFLHPFQSDISIVTAL